MRPLKFLPAVLACLFSLPQFADAAAKSSAAMDKLTANLKTCAKPAWPAESLRNGEEGAVTLSYLIGMDGRVLESKVEQSSGHPLLDLAAQDGLAKCLFASPETIGRYAPTWTKMMYVWTLEGGETPAEEVARLEKTRALAAAGDPEAIYRMSWYQFEGAAGLAKDIPEWLRLLRQSAALGYAPAQTELAVVLATGQHVETDTGQAIAWAKKAAAQGNAGAQVNLAMILLDVPEEMRDDELMFEMLEKAVAQGEPRAKGMLGTLLIQMDEGDRHRGLQLLIDAAAAQNRLAQHDLAQIYEAGELLPKDLAKARALYERSAAGGFAPARDALLRLQH